MGGVASRLAFLQPNFLPGSVRTIITFSTPHAIPPVSFDASLERVYSDVNDYWRQAYLRNDSDLAEVLLVSIAGGTADTTVASDYSAISSFAPASNGFTVFTTSIPTLFSPVDHLAMVWCDQLRKRVIHALFDCMDGSIVTKSRSIAERSGATRAHLLNGLAEQKSARSAGRQSRTVQASSVILATSATISLHDRWEAGLYGVQLTQGSDISIWTDFDVDALELYSCKSAHGDYTCMTIGSPAFITPDWATQSGSEQIVGKVARMAIEDADILLVEVPKGSSGFLFAGKDWDHLGTEASILGKGQGTLPCSCLSMLCLRNRTEGFLDSSTQR